MADDPATAITDTDVRTLAAKLKGLHALLTPGERALLDTALRRAAQADEAAEVEGYAWAVSFNPFPYLDAIRADPQRDAEASGG